MAITRLGGANAITGVIPTSVGGTGSTAATLPASLINDTSIGNITALPAAVVTGKVINYYSNVNTSASSISNTTSTVIQSPNITPTSTSSKFIITPTINWSSTNPNGAIFMYRELSGYNDLSPVQSISGNFGTTGNVKDLDEPAVPNNYITSTWSQTFVDSPNSTSQLNYTVRVIASSGSTTYINRANASADYKAVTTISILELSS